MNVTSYIVPELEKNIYLENQDLREKIKDWNKFQSVKSLEFYEMRKKINPHFYIIESI